MKARYLALSALVLSSCMDYSAPDSVVYGTVVATQSKSGTVWTDYATFTIDPTVTVVDQTGAVTDNCSVDGSQLVPTIKSQMEGRGYTYVDWNGVLGTNAELQIKMSATIGSQAYYDYYPGYCGWYPYYYCYPGWSYAGSYSFGTLVVDMADMTAAASDGKLPLVWTDANYAVLAGYYTGCSGSGNNPNWSKIQAAIVRAFDQSPYIQGPQ